MFENSEVYITIVTRVIILC